MNCKHCNAEVLSIRMESENFVEVDPTPVIYDVNGTGYFITEEGRIETSIQFGVKNYQIHQCKESENNA
jgi:hypothetical protein